MTKRLEQLLNMLQGSPKEPFILFAIAKEYEKADDKENALKYYNNLVTEAPDYVGTYYHLGKLHEALEQPEQAVSIYKKGMDIARAAGDTHTLSELAGAKLNLED